MAQDRSLDRHLTPARTFRPTPPDLWERLAAAVGARSRSAVLSDLVARYLDGRPMPPRPKVVP